MERKAPESRPSALSAEAMRALLNLGVAVANEKPGEEPKLIPPAPPLTDESMTTRAPSSGDPSNPDPAFQQGSLPAAPTPADPSPPDATRIAPPENSAESFDSGESRRTHCLTMLVEQYMPSGRQPGRASRHKSESES